MSRDGEPDKIYLDPKTCKAFLKILNQKSEISEISKSFKNINRDGFRLKQPTLFAKSLSGMNYEILRD